MSITSNMQSQGGKPNGLLGGLIGRLMNLNHNHVYNWALKNMDVSKNIKLLDIGCGGGKFLNLIAQKLPESSLCGIDHSEEMVKLATKINQKINPIEVKKASVSNIPYGNQTFDIITAIETIQFWPDLNNSLQDVKRVLKDSGTFLIINRFPQENSKWLDFLQIKSAKDYLARLTEAGFGQISYDITTNSNWIMVKASK